MSIILVTTTIETQHWGGLKPRHNNSEWVYPNIIRQKVGYHPRSSFITLPSEKLLPVQISKRISSIKIDFGSVIICCSNNKSKGRIITITSERRMASYYPLIPSYNREIVLYKLYRQHPVNNQRHRMTVTHLLVREAVLVAVFHNINSGIHYHHLYIH